MSRKKINALRLPALSCCLLLAAAGGARAPGQQGESGGEVTARREGRVRAPELEGGRGWLNTDRPLSIAGLRGKVVLLDFWTYGCINCMHVIPDLRRLEEKYAKELVVIGVHSAKFENEKETENIRRIILRYQIEHPVVNDADFRIWHAYAVNAWPTLVLEVREREGDREHTPHHPPLPDRAPRRQRRRLPHLARLRRQRVADARPRTS